MKKASLALIKTYKVLEPVRIQITQTFLGSDATCRFYPTCSDYTSQSIKKYGFIRGSIMGFWRVLRCNPWGGKGFDPVR